MPTLRSTTSRPSSSSPTTSSHPLPSKPTQAAVLSAAPRRTRSQTHLDSDGDFDMERPTPSQRISPRRRQPQGEDVDMDGPSPSPPQSVLPSHRRGPSSGRSVSALSGINKDTPPHMPSLTTIRENSTISGPASSPSRQSRPSGARPQRPAVLSASPQDSLHQPSASAPSEDVEMEESGGNIPPSGDVEMSIAPALTSRRPPCASSSSRRPMAEDLFTPAREPEDADMTDTDETPASAQSAGQQVRRSPWGHHVTQSFDTSSAILSARQAEALHIPMLCEICFRPYLTRTALTKHVNGHDNYQPPFHRLYRRAKNPAGGGDVLVLDSVTDAQLRAAAQSSSLSPTAPPRSGSTSTLNSTAPARFSAGNPPSSRPPPTVDHRPLRPARSLPSVFALPPSHSGRATTHRPNPSSLHGSSMPNPASETLDAGEGDGTEDEDLSTPFDKLKRLAVYPTIYKQIPPHLVPAFIAAAGRLAEIAYTKQDESSLLDFLAFVKVGLASGLRRRCAAERMEAYPDVDYPRPDETSRVRRPPAESATRLIQEGRLAAGMAALEGNTNVLDVDDEVIAALKAKHPTGEPHPFEGIPAPLGRRTVASPLAEHCLAALGSFRNDTAPGISGWTPSLLKLACKDERVVKLLVWLTEGILRGTAPGKQLLCASRLTPLSKPPRGVRPIAVGDLILRVAEKAIMIAAFDADSLLPTQFGVGTSTDAPVRLVARALKGDLGPSFTHLAALDAVNAFNETKRSHIAKAISRYAPQVFDMAKWLYGTPTALVVRNGTATIVLASGEGVKQGDVVASWFFSMAIRDFLVDLQTHLGPNHIVIAYLDDVFILGPDGDILNKVHDFMRTHPTPITLNPDKCRVRSFDDIRVNGMEMLGSILGPPSAVRTFLRHRVEAYRRTLEQHLPLLPTQHSLLLLRFVILPRIRYLLRSLPPADTKELWREVDRLTGEAVDRFRWKGCPPGRDAIDSALISLPLKYGGLGLNSLYGISPHAYAAATETADAVLSVFIPSISPKQSLFSQRDRCQDMYAQQQTALFNQLSTAERLVVYEGSSSIGRRYLTLTPYNKYLLIGDADMATALRHRSLMSLAGDICLACSAPSPGVFHPDSCARSQWIRTGRHESVKYALGRALGSLPDTTIDYEPLIHYSDRAARPLRFNDVRFSGAVGVNLPPMEFDISLTSLVGVQPLSRPLPVDESPLNATARHAERTLGDLSDNKRKKLPQMILPGATFYPFILSAGGLMHSETFDIWSRILRRLPPGAASFAVDTISVGLVKRRVKAITATEGQRAYEQAGERVVRSETSGSALQQESGRDDTERAGSQGLEEEGNGGMGRSEGSRSVHSVGMEWTASQEEREVNEERVTVVNRFAGFEVHM